MRRKNRRLRDAHRVDPLESPIDLELTTEEIMADLEPDWLNWHPGSKESETDSTDAAA